MPISMTSTATAGSTGIQSRWLRSIASGALSSLQMVLFGAVIIVFMLWRPRGLADLQLRDLRKLVQG
jgi:ABC-type branched-subunit amino acid transport system permease subunit